jgi:protein involved in sex pheromone biosynthesis
VSGAKIEKQVIGKARIMTLNLDLPPELEQYLLQEAERQGLSVEAMTLQLLMNSLQLRQKQAEAVDMLQSWIDDEDVEEQQETGEYLVQVLDENRLSERKLFPLEMKGVTW